MKSLTFYVGLSICPLLVSCASTRRVAELETVGPAPLALHKPATVTEGTLKVCSLRGIYNAEGVLFHPHTSYTLYSSDNVRLKEVQNARYPYSEYPVAVSLPAGNYVVSALADGSRRVRVPVMIEAGKLTTVYLEPSNRPVVADASDWVRLPNGKVVGWRVKNLASSGTSAQATDRPGQ